MNRTHSVVATALALSISLLSAAALAQTTPAAPSAGAVVDAHRKEDITKHRTIAAAHEAAARCLESGQKEGACHEALRKACAGVAVGRYCGMKHGH